jgi:hypothetical protein
MERGRMMVLHAVAIGGALYAGMRFGLKQSCAVAEDRSILIASLVLAYMVVFGHAMPGRINPNLA